MKGIYDNNPACGARKNKPNSKHVLSVVEWANFGAVDGKLSKLGIKLSVVEWANFGAVDGKLSKLGIKQESAEIKKQIMGRVGFEPT
ncbi:MAG: hypothetical protein ACYSTT_20630 [Planctomycetota bacterium]